MKSISLPRNIANRLLTLAQNNPQAEICGLIGAVNNIPTSVYPVKNIAGDKQHLFEMDAAGQIAAMKNMREKNEALFGIFHSHPDSPAEPSAIDLQQANYPEAIYLIISLNTKGVIEIKGFYLIDNEIINTELFYG